MVVTFAIAILLVAFVSPHWAYVREVSPLVKLRIVERHTKRPVINAQVLLTDSRHENDKYTFQTNSDGVALLPLNLTTINEVSLIRTTRRIVSERYYVIVNSHGYLPQETQLDNLIFFEEGEWRSQIELVPMTLERNGVSFVPTK